MKVKLTGLLLGTAALAALVSGPASAQTAASAEPAASEIGEIIVTAQKRSESVQKVPAAITAVGAETLEERGVTQASDLQFIAPSLQIGKLLGNTSIVIRGVGLNLVATSAPPGVAVHVDGVYQPITALADLAQVDLERVEIIRGPQGTLYGRNANGGAINFITKAPTSRFEGYVQAGYATYDESRLQGVINVPLGERVRARAVAEWTKRRDGFIKNVFPGSPDVDKGERVSGRLRVAADLTDNLTLDVTAARLHSSGPMSSYTLRDQPSPRAIAVNPYFGTTLVTNRPWRTAVNGPVESDRDFTLAAATVTLDLGKVQLKSISGYQKLSDKYLNDDDTTQLTAFVARPTADSRTFTQEFNLSGTVGPVDAVLGIFYMDDDYASVVDYTFPLGFGTLPGGSRLVYDQIELKTRALALFGDATVNLTDRFRLIAGIRFGRDKQSHTQRAFIDFSPTRSVTICPLQTNEQEFESTTPRAGMQYDLSDNSNAYATFSKGFKVGGYNRTGCNQSYEPERITSYEVGIKNRLFDGTVILNASAFYYDYSNLQLQQQVGLGQRITNAAGAKVKGVEVEGLWRPDPHWIINANIALLDAEYTKFMNVDNLAPELGFQDLAGNRLNNAPKEAANVGVSYRTDQLSFGRLTFRADVSQRTRIYFREFNNVRDSQSGYTTLNLGLIWDSPDDTYRLRIYGNNITNKPYIVSMSAAESYGSRYITWGSPRQIGVELRANF